MGFPFLSLFYVKSFIIIKRPNKKTKSKNNLKNQKSSKNVLNGNATNKKKMQKKDLINLLHIPLPVRLLNLFFFVVKFKLINNLNHQKFKRCLTHRRMTHSQ